jgi:hypothetical protein
MNAGDTILIPEPGTSYDSHLWMVISDPTQGDECVIVNFTSWRADKDQSCVVLPGEHEYVRNKTCVNFKDAKRCRIGDLESLISSRHLTTRAPLSTGLLAKIRQAVPESRMNWSCVQLLIQQAVIGAD